MFTNDCDHDCANCPLACLVNHNNDEKDGKDDEDNE